MPSLATFNYSTSFTARIYRRESSRPLARASVDVTDKFQLTAGVAPFRLLDRRERQGNNSGYTYGGAIVLPWVRIEQQATRASNSLRTIKITPDNMIHAVASQGYRPGGIVSSFDKSYLPQLQQLGYGTPPAQYVPDRLWNFEVGSKNQFLDRRLTLNVDAYYIKWKNTQVAQNLQCGNQFISNAGGGDEQGSRAESRPIPSTRSICPLAVRTPMQRSPAPIRRSRWRKGADMPNDSRDGRSARQARYNWTMGDSWRGFAHADLQYVDGRYSGSPPAATNVYESLHHHQCPAGCRFCGSWGVGLAVRAQSSPGRGCDPRYVKHVRAELPDDQPAAHHRCRGATVVLARADSPSTAREPGLHALVRASDPGLPPSTGAGRAR